MGITADQAKSVKDFWNGAVAKDLQGHGVKIFCGFLGAHPDQQANFSKFKDVAQGSLASNGEVAKQALAVMKELGKYIQVVDNAGSLKSASSAMAASHKKMGIVKANFDKIFPGIIDYVVSAGGDRAAWQAAMNSISDAITSQQ